MIKFIQIFLICISQKIKILASAVMRFKFFAIIALNLCVDEDLSKSEVLGHRLYDLDRSSCFYLLMAIIEHKFLFVNIFSRIFVVIFSSNYIQALFGDEFLLLILSD